MMLTQPYGLTHIAGYQSMYCVINLHVHVALVLPGLLEFPIWDICKFCCNIAFKSLLLLRILLLCAGSFPTGLVYSFWFLQGHSEESLERCQNIWMIKYYHVPGSILIPCVPLTMIHTTLDNRIRPI